MIQSSVVNVVLVVTVLISAWLVLRRVRRVALSDLERTSLRAKSRGWSHIFLGLAFVAYGIAAAYDGRTSIKTAEVQGGNVQIAGVLIALVGGGLFLSGLRRR